MAGKISELTAATSVAGADQVELLQGGVNKRAAVGLLPQPVHRIPFDVGAPVASTSAFKFKANVLQATSAGKIHTIYARYSYSTTVTTYDLHLVKGTVSGSDFTVTSIVQSASFTSVAGGTNGNMSMLRMVLTTPQVVAPGEAYAVVFSQNGAAANFASRIAGASTNNSPDSAADPWPLTGSLSAARADTVTTLAVGSVLTLVAGNLFDSGFQVSL